MSAKETQTKLKDWAPNPDITKDELAAMQVEVLDRIITARVGLLLRHPFFGNLATRLRIQACDDWCMTAATDGRNLYYNTQFFNAMDNKEIEFVTRNTVGSFGLKTNFSSLSGTKGKLSYYTFFNYKEGDGYRANSNFDSKKTIKKEIIFLKYCG